MNNIKVIASDKKFKGAPPLDQHFNIELEQQYLEMVEGDRSVPLNLAERFNEERQNISEYRLYGKIQPFIDNAYSGITDPSQSRLFYNMYNIGSSLTGQPIGFPEFEEFDFIRLFNSRTQIDESVGDETNWNIYVTVPSTCNSTQPMAYQPQKNGNTLSFVASDGIPFHIQNITKGGKKLIQFKCAAPHGLKVGEYAQLNIPIQPNYPSGFAFINNRNTFPVYSVGDGTRKSDLTIFSLVIPEINYTLPLLLNTLGTFKRQILLNDPTTLSYYYVIEHEIITNVKDYNLNKCAFAKGVFKKVEKFQPAIENPDVKDRVSVKVAYPSYLYVISKDINVKNYLDNLKKPLTTLYITIMLRSNLGYFDYPPNYGWGWNFPYDFADSNVNNFVVRGATLSDAQPVTGIIFNQSLTSANLKSGIPLHPGDRLRGEFAEYNMQELKERIISDIRHRFNFNSFIFTGGEAGYVYKPHYPVPIRVYSDYIEEGDPTKVAHIPFYATYFKDEKIWKWRDLYDIGFIEAGRGVDYPFINTAHYPQTDIDFRVHRTIRADAFTDISISANTLENFVVDGCE